MPDIPEIPFRQTRHKKPRYQLYMPGFNPANGCWLEGDWITVSKEEYASRQPEHQRLFGDLYSKSQTQHYRDGGVPLDQMTEAQRLAYEHYSGDLSLEGRDASDNAVLFRVRMAGNKLGPGQLDWMREHGYRAYRTLKNAHTGEIRDQLEGLDLPCEFVIDGDPVDLWAEVVEQNKQREMEMFKGLLASVGSVRGPKGAALGPQLGGFIANMGVKMAAHSLVVKEQSIIRSKWKQSRGENDPYADIDRDVREYIEMRDMLKTALGSDFNEVYEAQRKTHNECARANLDNSNGSLFCYVLPKFNDDGTHEPWGERDVPWGQHSDE